MGVFLYKLSNLHTWETKIGGRGGGRIPYCKLRERQKGGGAAVYQPNHRKSMGFSP